MDLLTGGPDGTVQPRVLGYLPNRATGVGRPRRLQKGRGAEGPPRSRRYRSPTSRRTRRSLGRQAKARRPSGTTVAPFHGVGRPVAKGYPTLNDDDWVVGAARSMRSRRTARIGVRSGTATDHESVICPPSAKMHAKAAENSDGRELRASRYGFRCARVPTRGGKKGLCRQLRRVPRRRRARQKRARREP